MDRAIPLRLFVYLMAAFLVMPPGFGTTRLVASTASRTADLTRESKLETLRNPQFSSGTANRFLYALSPGDLLGGGGESFKNPTARGYGAADGPPTLWLPNEGRVEWGETEGCVEKLCPNGGKEPSTVPACNTLGYQAGRKYMTECVTKQIKIAAGQLTGEGKLTLQDCRVLAIADARKAKLKCCEDVCEGNPLNKIKQKPTQQKPKN